MMAFDPLKLVDLDECVEGALNLFVRKRLPRLHLGRYERPIVLGSGNAAVTGRIIMEGTDAVFADESTYKRKLAAVKNIDGAILISASGSKHAPILAKDLRRRGIEVRLLTNNAEAPAAKYADKVFVFPKQAEPYTYNTSTYMGMILAKTKENPKTLLNFLRKLKIPGNLSKFNAFYIMVPPRFDGIREMFLTKFDELFGPMVSGRIFTTEQTKHAKTIVPSDRELFVSIGCENKTFGKNRLNLPLPRKADYGAIMAVGYFFIGKIQKQKPPYFKKNIVQFTKKASKLFGQEIKPVVE